jgi:hypothetical protein
MTLLAPWVVFPLVLGLLSLGCGLTLDYATGRRIPALLLLPAGLAATTVIAGFTTFSARSAPLTVPVVVGIAVLGFGLAGERARGMWDPYVAACALVAFLAVGAPVLASGKPTFTGYIKLDDTATFLALTDRALEHGRNLQGLAPSSYEATLSVNLAHGYPTGSLLPLGAAARLVGTDAAWLFQPYLAFLAAMLALGLYALAASVLPRRLFRALAAAVASQAALVYGFAMWGGVKELYAAALLTLVAATVVLARDSLRAVSAPATAAAALMLASSAGAIVWLLGAGVVVLAAWHGRPRLATPTVVATLVLSLPALAESGQFLRGDNRASFQDTGELGNLIHPLSPLQALGIWPSADFRAEPAQLRVTAALLGLTVVAAVLGLFAVRHRALPLLVYATSCIAGAGLISVVGSPWLAAKALAVASPAAILLGLVGASCLRRRGMRAAGAALAVALVGGVLWSDVLAFRGASLAPYDRLAELEDIGTRFAGHGPALMTEYQPYGVRHFLRRLDAEGATELRRRPVPLLDGRPGAKGTSPDLDAIEPAAVDIYRTIVLRRLPRESGPPAPYALTWSGRFYDVWQRQAQPTVLEHVPLGDSQAPAGRAPCRKVLRLAELARKSAGLLAARRPPSAQDPSVLYFTPSDARSLCGRTVDWLEVVSS